MKKWDAIENVLDFAIENEQEAAAFYTDLAAKAERAWMKAVFEGFAKEERGHEAKLKAVKTGKFEFPPAEKVQDLKIGDYLVDVDPKAGELDYQEALIVAMKKEKAAFRLYNDLAQLSQNQELKTTFLALAQEEAKHKLRFEVEYDDYVLREN